MTTYQPNIPTGLVNLDTDYANIQGNFQQLDTTFGVDHYTYSNATVNNGFHNKVTTPAFVDNPPTGLPPVTAANPVFYAFQQYPAVGVLQYSRGPSNALPTPVTNLYSGTTPIVIADNATSNVLDFTGIARAICTLSCMDTVIFTPQVIQSYAVFWSGTAFSIRALTGVSTFLIAQNTGNILQLKNNGSGSSMNDVYWALNFTRLD